MEKLAGQIIDQSTDPGFVFQDEFAQFWPEDWVFPELGISKRAGLISDSEGNSYYSTDTAEDTLLSSMYFERFGHEFLNEDEIEKIAGFLENYRIIFGVEMPEGFQDFCKQASERPSVEEIYADPADCLPITTPEQALASIEMFNKNASAWSSRDQIIASHNLKVAAVEYGLDVDILYDGRMDISDELDQALEFRKRAAIQRNVEPSYIEKLSSLQNEQSFNLAQEIEDIDRQYHMDDLWGRAYPTPVDTVISSVEKKASHGKWASMDLSPLKDVFNEDLYEKIVEDPDVVIPSLPLPYRNIIEEKLNG